jgi:hypothetical protein
MKPCPMSFAPPSSYQRRCEVTDSGRVGSAETGSRASAEPVARLGPTGFDPARGEWRRDALPFDKRPMRQFVWLSGERFHSGVRWRRDHWGLAYIRPDGIGYRDEDIAQLEQEGDMDAGTGEVYGWLPACTPAYFDMGQREGIAVNASCDTHPKDGDAQQAPLVSGAVPLAGDAQSLSAKGRSE